MKFSELAIYFLKIEEVSSRLTITSLLAELFEKLTPEELEKTVYLLQGRVVPVYEKIEFGMAEKTVIKAIISALNVERGYFEKENRKNGDLGKTVEFFKKQYISFEEKDLTILEAYDQLYKAATASGDKSQDYKIQTLSLLIRQLDALSARYLVRIPQAIMRLGFSDMTVLDAYSWMLTGDKSLRPEIEKAYHVRPDLGYIGKVIKQKGIEGMKSIQPVLFTPIIMMRAERLSSGQEIIAQIGLCGVEPKYDGFRLQVHYRQDTGEVHLYSRSLEEVSYMYPDIIRGVIKEVKARELIFEGEAIGFDLKTDSFLPFQETVQRKRKYGVEEKALEIPLKLFCFELLYADGTNYIGKPFSVRRRQLEHYIPNTTDAKNHTVLLAPHTLTDKGDELESMFDHAISEGLEGIIAKKREGVYQPGARGWNWIKFKRSYSSKIHDTIDCVVMGYDAGKGKRTGFGIGAFLVGVYDEQNARYITMAKIGTGLTDEEWLEMKKRADKVKNSHMPTSYFVNKNMYVDQWVDPHIIVEIKADEITKSPVHTAEYALRFPRLERFRDDKDINNITTLTEIHSMVKAQEKER